ncbi:MAG: Crp/Fnr family transcriptional regulator [Armatimonadetes bacterium]|nr:Crp/Fnr family transcriptional regulator [Armatimonadota bacterium]
MQTLMKVPFLAKIDCDHLNTVARHLRRREVRRGDVLFVEGDKGQAAYFVHSGAVKVYQLSSEGRERIVHYERAGGFFNLVPLLDGGPNPGTAEVLEDGVFYELRRGVADQLMGLCPVFTRAIATMLAGRMRYLAYAVGEQSLRHVGGRLAQLLMDLADREGEKRSGGVLLPRLSQEELASLVGTVRECVSRVLSELRQQGVVRMEGRRIVVINRPALAALAG